LADSVRAFIAVEIPSEERARLGVIQEELRRFKARVSWPHARNLHCTLVFLGDVDRGRTPALVAAVADAANATAPFELSITGSGGFPSLRRPRVLWAGLADPSGALARLRARVSAALDEAGFQVDRKPFHPHLTLGRVKDERDSGLEALVATLQRANLDGRPFQVTALHVKRSTLAPTGASYDDLAVVPFLACTRRLQE
jgi:2'-5' RNA ligase